MEFENPDSKEFTIYSKSGCINCRKVKDLLKKMSINFITIDCYDYLLEDKEGFLSFIKNYTVNECKTFPMVFHNGNFIGSFNEVEVYIDKISAFNF